MDGAQFLLSPEGWALVNALPEYRPDDAARLSAELRKAGHSPELVSAALTQQRLRAKARAKFGEGAGHMLFTEAGLQQATRLAVATHHARRFRDAGCERLVDLTSGIGADAMAAAALGLDVTAIDADELTAACLTINLAPFPNARAEHGDSLARDLTGFDGAFADPARRTARGRTFNPADYAPPLDRVLAIREQIPALGVKVAPGIGYEHLPADAHAQWISVDGDVVEAGLWFGPLAQSPGRSALVISGTGTTAITATSDPTAPVVPLEPAPLGAYLYEPDGAVIRAGAIAAVGEKLLAAPVSNGIAYLTGDDLVQTPLATAFEVLDAMPVKQLAGYLRERQVGALEILKRGMDVRPDEFRKKLKLRGPGSATVILTRLRGRHSAVVVRRLPAQNQPAPLDGSQRPG